MLKCLMIVFVVLLGGGGPRNPVSFEQGAREEGWVEVGTTINLATELDSIDAAITAKYGEPKSEWDRGSLCTAAEAEKAIAAVRATTLCRLDANYLATGSDGDNGEGRFTRVVIRVGLRMPDDRFDEFMWSVFERSLLSPSFNLQSSAAVNLSDMLEKRSPEELADLQAVVRRQIVLGLYDFRDRWSVAIRTLPPGLSTEQRRAIEKGIIDMMAPIIAASERGNMAEAYRLSGLRPAVEDQVYDGRYREMLVDYLDKMAALDPALRTMTGWPRAANAETDE